MSLTVKIPVVYLTPFSIVLDAVGIRGRKKRNMFKEAYHGNGVEAKYSEGIWNGRFIHSFIKITLSNLNGLGSGC